MINRLSTFFWRAAGVKTFLAGLLLEILFGTVIMPWGAANFNKLSNRRVEVLDLKFSYNPQMARNIIGAYSPAARGFAIKFGLIADTLYPLAYTFFFTITLAWILKSLSRYGIRIKHLHLFPLLILILDYCENIGIASLMSNYPDFSDFQVYVASFFSSLKWAMVGVLAAISISGLVALTGKAFLNRNN